MPSATAPAAATGLPKSSTSPTQADPALTWARFYKLKLAAVGGSPSYCGEPEHDKLVQAWDAAARICYRKQPTTLAGCLALLEVILSREAGCVHDAETDIALETLRSGLARLVSQ